MTETTTNSLPAAVRSPALLKDRFQGDHVGDGWTMYTVPHKPLRYFYNRELNIVTTEYMSNPESRLKFQSEYPNTSSKCHLLETVAHEGIVTVVDHEMETFGEDQFSHDESRGRYWGYVHNFPCHRELPAYAEAEALRVLQLMAVQNLVNPTDVVWTPFNMQVIHEYTDFLTFSNSIHDGLRIAKVIVISLILATFSNSNEIEERHSRTTSGLARPSKCHWWHTLSKIVITIACCSMPPTYVRRFVTSLETYRRSFRPMQWHSFLDEVGKERVGTNVVVCCCGFFFGIGVLTMRQYVEQSGLLLASSMAFLAVPGLVDVAQFFIILSIVLSLGSVVIGVNSGVEQKLSELRQIGFQDRPDSDEKLIEMAHAMEQHYAVLLLSVLCFFLSVFSSTAFSIYSSVFVSKSFTVRYLFFALAVGGLMIILGVIFRWNRRFLLSEDTTHDAILPV